MAAKKIEDWVGNLPGVGLPIDKRVDEIKSLERKVAQLNERIRLARVALRGRVISLWSVDEIKAAKEVV